MEESTVLLPAVTHIFSGKGGKRNRGGQRVYNLLIPMWAALYNLLDMATEIDKKSRAKSKSKFLDCVYLGMKQGGAMFLARDRQRELAIWNQLPSKTTKKKYSQNYCMVFKPMDPLVAREMIRNALSHYKNQVDLFLEYKKEEAKEVLTELGGPNIDSTNFNKWRDKCEQLYKEEIKRYTETQGKGMNDKNEIMVVTRTETNNACIENAATLLNSLGNKLEEEAV